MGLCYSKQPLVEDEKNRSYDYSERKTRRKREALFHRKQWSISPNKALNTTTSRGSSTIRIPTAECPQSSCSHLETMRSAESVEEQSANSPGRKTRRVAVEDEEKIEVEHVASTSEEWNETPLDLEDVSIHSSSLEPEAESEENSVVDIITSLKSSNVFHSLEEKTLNKIASVMRLECYADGDVIIRQGHMPQSTDCMYCVASGEVLLQISGTQNDHRDAIIKKSGWIFGDISLLFNSPRSASVVAHGECKLYSLNRVEFIKLMKNVPKIRLLRFLRKLPFLKSVSDNKLVTFGEQVKIKEYNKGDLIVDQTKHDNNQFYIIRKGNVRVRHEGLKSSSVFSLMEDPESKKGGIDVLGRGHFFGVDKEIHSAYYASSHIEVVVVKHEDYQKLGNISLYWKLIEESVINILNELGTVDISSLRLGDVVNQNYLSSAKEGDILLQEGENLKYLCVVVKGKISCIPSSSSYDNDDDDDIIDSSSSFIKSCKGTQYFGEDWEAPSRSTGDIITTSNRLQYLQIPHRLLAQAGVTNSGQLVTQGPKISDRILHALPVEKRNEKTQVAFHDLEQYRVVGEGQYGKVRLVVHKHTRQEFALKSIQKSAVKDIKTVEHIIMERKVLSKLSGKNFLVGFHGAFQDNSSLYLLMDWIPGGELFSRITLSGMLHEYHAVFYAANVVLAFNTMHEMNIIYRDLKPENILIDKNGYLRLSDYGFATIADSAALTLCGTPDYQAPEIISRQGAHKASDFWALGVLIFEMLTGDAPFKSPTDDPWDTYRRILSGRFYIPDYVSHTAANLIVALLQVDPRNRLGYQSNDGEKIKSHPWFKSINWDRLENQKTRAPFIPRLTNSLDTSCFDHYDNSIDSTVPSPRHNFFTQNHHWAALWDWVQEF
eukprot:g3900.t1